MRREEAVANIIDMMIDKAELFGRLVTDIGQYSHTPKTTFVGRTILLSSSSSYQQNTSPLWPGRIDDKLRTGWRLLVDMNECV